MPRWAVAGLIVIAGLAIAGIIFSTIALYVLESRVRTLEVGECHQHAVLHEPPPPYC
jgi:hypothetical protein